MNKEEYLNELKTYLLSLSSDERDEALQYYSDYFDEASDDAKVIEELGSPKELSNTIIEKLSNALAKTESVKQEESSEQENPDYGNALFYSFNKEEVKSLKLSIGIANVVLIKGDTFSVETRGINSELLTCCVKNGVLTIKKDRIGGFNFFSHNGQNQFVPKLLITIPANVALDKLSITLGAGKMRTKDVSIACDFANISVGAGDLVLENIESKKANIKCGMGNFEYSGKLSGKNNIDCGMGNVKVNLTGNAADYSYDLKLALGNFNFNGEQKTGVCQVFNNPKKENHFSVNCGMGNVIINLK